MKNWLGLPNVATRLIKGKLWDQKTLKQEAKIGENNCTEILRNCGKVDNHLILTPDKLSKLTNKNIALW